MPKIGYSFGFVFIVNLRCVLLNVVPLGGVFVVVWFVAKLIVRFMNLFIDITGSHAFIPVEIEFLVGYFFANRRNYVTYSWL